MKQILKKWLFELEYKRDYCYDNLFSFKLLDIICNVLTKITKKKRGKHV